MKAVVAMDSFKGSLSSIEAGYAVAEGIKRVDKSIDTKVVPLADGGEGTVEALVFGGKGNIQNIQVTGPLGKKISCKYGIMKDTKTAVIEMSGAAGIMLLSREQRNPLYTTTYGVGEIIKDAITKGCKKFIVGIGGSATNDGGIGMLQALGFGFLNKAGKQVSFGAEGLKELEMITNTNVLSELAECKFKIACDVTNVLYGERGCSAVYGSQKGASSSMIWQMDKWMKHYAVLAEEKYSNANPYQSGAGAAGGVGFAFSTFLNAILESGVKIVLEEMNLERDIAVSDIVITGEGQLDKQTTMGKAPIGVAKLAKKYKKPVIAFAGCVTKEARKCNQNGIDAFFPILRGAVSLEEAMKQENAKENLIDTAEQVFRLFTLKKNTTA